MGMESTSGTFEDDPVSSSSSRGWAGACSEPRARDIMTHFRTLGTLVQRHDPLGLLEEGLSNRNPGWVFPRRV